MEESYGELKVPAGSRRESYGERTEPTAQPSRKNIAEFGGPIVEIGGVEWKQAGADESYGELTEPEGNSQAQKKVSGNLQIRLASHQKD